MPFPIYLQRGSIMSDWVAIASYLSVGFAVAMVVFLAIKVKKLMNSTHSDD